MPHTQWTLPEQFDEYRLVRMLGRGSMGVVFLGHDLVLDRPVAIKFLNVVDANARARERFLTEARAAARIQHPNVMAVYRVGELEGRLYIIGEYIRGQSLSELPRPAPAKDILKIGIDLARGLACAHRMGVLHRDVKLANAMLSESGEVKLLDFSLAKLLEATPEDASPPTAATSLHDEPTLEPESQSMPRVTIDAGARGGRAIDASLAASPTRSPRPDQSPRPSSAPALENTESRAAAVNVAAQRVRIDESSDTSVVGTPFYMAPELWRGEPSSRATDVYACGVLLYILSSGSPPLVGASAIELARLSQETVPKPLRSVAPWVDERFAAIVDRCLRPPSERYASGDELCSALEGLALVGSGTDAVGGNPYRGLQAFEARHRSVFFGRGAEIRAVVDRMHADPFVLVAGDSGVGKSSLSRAGALPVFADQARDGRAWTTLSLMPGRRPLQTLVSALAPILSEPEQALRERFAEDPAEVVRELARTQGKDRGLIFFIDQLEELVTLADRQQLAPVGRFLAELADGPAGLRLLATVRGDFLTRVAALPHIGPHINAAIYLLTPLSESGLREAIVGPAALQDVRFESDALVEELVVAGIEGSLPLLQFALAELWEARAPGTREITSEDLERIGRVNGALARHADNVVGELPPPQRVAARRLLLRLVTIEDTRASLLREDLVVGDPLQDAALEALVRGRLVVAREAQDGNVYEIAHEALIRNWGSLQRWISDGREAREVTHRLELAALEWQRLGSARIGLWTADQLAETQQLVTDDLRPRELAFITASRRQLQRQRRLRWILILSVPSLLLAIFIGVRIQQAFEQARRVDEQVAQARASLAQGRSGRDEALRLRRQAFAQFDQPDPAAGEATWELARAAAALADRKYRSAIQEFEVAQRLDPERTDIRPRLADALLERAIMAEETHRKELAAELIERLGRPLDAAQLDRWEAPGVLTLRSDPPVPAVLARYVQDPESLRYGLGELRELGTTPISGLELAQGSYRLSLTLADGRQVNHPFVVERGAQLEFDLELPRPGTIPDGFIYVPAGTFRFGSDHEEILRRFFLTVPEHEVATKAFLIARYETTYEQWIAYLEDLSADERDRILAGNASALIGAGVALSRDLDGTWTLTISAGVQTYRAPAGEPIVYKGRSERVRQSWLKMPVSAVNWADARGYIQWLDRTRRVPGARPCSELEWERAARGADGRHYPHGDDLDPADAHIDATYGQVPEAAGPDVVGSYPASQSPFGVEDMAGNVLEWTLSSLAPDSPVLRGGSFGYDRFVAYSLNRVLVDPELRDTSTGIRVCATPADSSAI